MDNKNIQIDYLYRYTSLENLILTLKYHTIRFNPLDKMDDLQEKKTQDLRNIGRFFYISSWTAEEKEDIPMWKMYTDMQSGVRLKMQKNPFRRQKTRSSEFSKATGMIPQEGSLEELDTFLDLSSLASQKVFSPQAYHGNILFEMQYTEDIDCLEPTILHMEKDNLNLSTEKIGKFKNTYWAFQKEWRYILNFYPVNWAQDPTLALKDFQDKIIEIAQDIATPIFDHYDVELDDKSFASMEITPSPKMSAANIIILKDLVEKYNPTAKIVKSELLGKL